MDQNNTEYGHFLRSANDPNTDLKKRNQWTYQWKMQFNPDRKKQANEVTFSRKSYASNLTYSPVKPIPPWLNLTVSALLNVLIKNISELF